jgi:AraC-like DNA-binding protein
MFDIQHSVFDIQFNMQYYIIQPSELLKPYVRCFWVFEHNLAVDEPEYIYRSVADGCAEIVFHYKGVFDDISENNNGSAANYRSGLQAQTSQFSRFITKESFAIFGVYLYPYAIPRLFGLPADEVTNAQLDLQLLLGPEGSFLEERIMLANDNAKRVNILGDFLEKQLLRNRLMEKSMMIAVKYAIHDVTGGTVSDLAAKFSLSTRQFDRKFKAYSGFSPKMYLRLTRLQKALKQYGCYKSLTQVAYECGYYDQSHFIHDVKAFTGYHPGFYFSGKAEGTEYRNV